MLDLDKAHEILVEADCLYPAEQVEEAIELMAEKIIPDYELKNPLVLCVMKGGAFTACAVLKYLHFPLEFDYLQITRYRNTTEGGELEWIIKPSTVIKNRHILIVDDIFDEGITLEEVIKYCEAESALSVKVAVLTRKLHQRALQLPAVKYIALDVPDRYMFGCGMDYQGYFRNMNSIYAIGKSEAL